MAEQLAIVKEVFMAPGSAAMPATLTGVLPLGFRGDKAALNITHFNEIKEERGRVFGNMLNFELKSSSLEMTYAGLAMLVGFTKANDVSVAVVTSGALRDEEGLLTAAGGLFKFENTSSLGLEWELLITPKDRKLSYTLARAFRLSDGQTLITASKTNSLPATYVVPSENADNVVNGFINPLFGSLTIGDERLNDFKISLKTAGTKNGFNRMLNRRVEVAIEGTLNGPDPDEVLAFLASAIGADDLTIEIPTVSGTCYINLAAGGISQYGSAELGEDKREAKVMLVGSYDIGDITCDTDTINFGYVI